MAWGEGPTGADSSAACHKGSPGTWEILPSPLEHPVREVWVNKTPGDAWGRPPMQERRQDAGGTDTRGNE